MIGRKAGRRCCDILVLKFKPSFSLWKNLHTAPHPHGPPTDSGPDTKEGDLTLRIESGDKRVTSESWSGLLYVAAGSDPFQLIERGKNQASSIHTAVQVFEAAPPFSQTADLMHPNN